MDQETEGQPMEIVKAWVPWDTDDDGSTRFYANMQKMQFIEPPSDGLTQWDFFKMNFQVRSGKN